MTPPSPQPSPQPSLPLSPQLPVPSQPPLDQLIAVMARLRAPGGCAWDREQTHHSLVRYLVEETYELVEAIENGDREELVEELGDVLYQVLFHSDIAEHTPGEGFDIQDVAAAMTRKMIGRHPHVFGDATAETADDVMAVWDELKSAEKPHRTSVLDGIPQGMPALALADKMIGRAEKVGVTIMTDPESADRHDPLPRTEEQLGSLLLRIVAGAREQGLDAERALRATLRGVQRQIREAELDPIEP